MNHASHALELWKKERLPKFQLFNKLFYKIISLMVEIVKFAESVPVRMVA